MQCRAIVALCGSSEQVKLATPDRLTCPGIAKLTSFQSFCAEPSTGGRLRHELSGSQTGLDAERTGLTSGATSEASLGPMDMGPGLGRPSVYGAPRMSMAPQSAFASIGAMGVRFSPPNASLP